MTRKLYYHDALTLEFEAPAASATGRGGRSAVALEATYFYPTSGGQPHDTGTLGGARVVEVTEEGDEVLHWLEGDPGPGPWKARIDAARRRDHMEQHTGQHVLSAAFVAALKAPTVSFHMGAETSTIDVELRDPSRLAEAEALANRVVAEDRPVTVYEAARDQVEALGLRKPPAVDGSVRVVDVEGFDRSACGGTHVATTGRIQLIKVLGAEKVRENCRVEFVCGGRALRDYATKHDALKRLSARFTTGVAQVEAVVEKKIEEAAAQRRSLEKLEQELAGYEAERFAREAVVVSAPGGPVTPEGPGGAAAPRLLVRWIEGRSAAYLRALSAGLQGREGLVYVLGLASDNPAWIVGHGPGVELDLRVFWKEWSAGIGAKGGGKADLIQGGGLSGAAPADALGHAETMLRGTLGAGS
ncbi:MAG: alanyl-tRNA editing protein [Candidatus Eisenbacteria bacterium]|nr:alanyl-tRNA editing protein [Candidatus Eisenbacteria bacterium]